MHTRTPSLPDSQWHQLRAAYMAGAGLRALAREAGIPAGTLLARCHREGWTADKRRAIATAQATRAAPKVPAAIAVANEAAGRAERHVERMERLCEVVGTHAESLPVARLFEGINRVDALDRLARRTYGLDSGSNGPVVQVLFTGQECLRLVESELSFVVAEDGTCEEYGEEWEV